MADVDVVAAAAAGRCALFVSLLISVRICSWVYWLFSGHSVLNKIQVAFELHIMMLIWPKTGTTTAASAATIGRQTRRDKSS